MRVSLSHGAICEGQPGMIAIRGIVVRNCPDFLLPEGESFELMKCSSPQK